MMMVLMLPMVFRASRVLTPARCAFQIKKMELPLHSSSAA
jgi:hypothetical protein